MVLDDLLKIFVVGIVSCLCSIGWVVEFVIEKGKKMKW